MRLLGDVIIDLVELCTMEDLSWAALGRRRGQSQSGAHLDEHDRAPKPHDENEHAALYEADERILKGREQSSGSRVAALRALQFRECIGACASLRQWRQVCRIGYGP